MASIRKHGTGWRAEVARNGRRASRIFATKREATDWAARQEYLILNADKLADRKPLAEVFTRYAREVSITKRGGRQEGIRLAQLSRDKTGKMPIGDVRAADLADWRDKRLRAASPGTVIRDMTLLSSVFSQARREWGMIAVNPMADVRRPPQPRARDRLPIADEIERLRVAAGDDLRRPVARTFVAFLFACQTAMRAGEIAGLTWAHIDIERRVARLEMTKNGTAREVPLSSEAVRLLQSLPRSDPVFDLSALHISANFQALRARAKVDGLTFHDSRAEATTRLAGKVDVLTLARITGHKDIKMLLRYYRETAEDIAKRLD